MPTWLFRFWVLLLAVLLRVGGGLAQADAAQLGELDNISLAPASGDAEAPEESSQSSSAVDEVLEADLLPSNHPRVHGQELSGCEQRCGGGLSPGRPASDTPFKPPRR